MSKEKWFQEAVEVKAPFTLGGWHKDESAQVRRAKALASRDQSLPSPKQYLSAARALQALANVTKDAKTKEVASADAKYFFSMAKGKEMAVGGTLAAQGGDLNTPIKNQYAGKTAEEVWNAWTKEQRLHFCTDHCNELGLEQEAFADYALSSFSDLAEPMQRGIEKHISEGQYSAGGEIPATEIITEEIIVVAPIQTSYWGNWYLDYILPV